MVREILFNSENVGKTEIMGVYGFAIKGDTVYKDGRRDIVAGKIGCEKLGIRRDL